MQSRLSLNIKVAKVADWGVTRAFVKRLDPVVLVACIDSMNDRNRILELQADNPNTIIVGRFIDQQKDGGYHTKPDNGEKWLVSPSAFLDAYGELGRDGRVLYVINEPSGEADSDTIARLVEWLLEVIRIATERGIALCVLNWGVGHPLLFNKQWDARFDDVLEAVSKSTLHYLGVHLYAPADLYGRLDAMIARCKVIKGGIRPPRTIVTETGFDAAYGGDPLNGYHSRGYSGLYYANWGIDKVRNLYSPYIRDGVIIGLCVFIWGDDVSWKEFNVENDTDWKATILAAKDKGELTINAQAVKPTVPAPANKGTPTHYTITTEYNLRASASATGTDVGDVKTGERINLYKDTATMLGNNKWHYIERDTSPAAESASGWIAWPLPVETVPPDEPPTLPPPFEMNAAYVRSLALAYEALGNSHALASVDSFRLRDQYNKLAEALEGKVI